MYHKKSSLLLAAIILCFCHSLYAAEYIVGVRAYNGIEQAEKKWNATLKYLSEKIPEHSFTLKPIVSMNDITLAASKKNIDFLLTQPSSFVEIRKRYGVQALVTLNNRRAGTAQNRFGTVIFTHAANEEILTLKDIKGKSLMAVSEPAFGGWQVAWFELLKHGIDPYHDLEALLFSETKFQQEVVYAVRDRKADVGVVRTDQLERMASAGEIDMRYFRILNNKDVKGFPFFLSTDLYPEWPFAALQHVPTEIAQQVKQVLLALPANSPAAKIGKYVGWIDPLDYSPVEKLLANLKIPPFVSPEN